MQLAILTYHNLDDSGSPVSASPAMFERHLAALAAAGFTVLPLGEAFARLAARAGERLAAITFDDGYAAVHRHALPLLERYGWRATVLPVVDYVGRDNRWPGQPSFVPPDRLLTWDELATLVRHGWEVGAHTRTHPDLAAVGTDALDEEVVGAKRLLEERLGQPVRVFAYPYGRYSPPARARVRDTYALACTTEMGLVRRTSDRHALERLDMWYFSQPLLDRLFASRLMRPYVRLCSLARRGRVVAGRPRGRASGATA